MNEVPETPVPPHSASRRAVLTGAAAGVAGLVVGGALPASAATPPAPAATSPTSSPFPQRPRTFVQVRAGEFVVDGDPFRFGGTNNYYLHERSHYMIDSVLNDAAAMNLAVLRAWAFMDGAEHSGKVLQPRPGVYNSADFDSLDYAIYKAGTLGIRLVLPLVNNWPDYGGMSQYVTWFLGLPDDVYGDAVNHDRFYTDRNIKAAYKAYAQYVTHRRNPYTGLRYHDDPTIMTFELANEPRCRSDKSGRTLLAWADEMSHWVKKQAPRQLVAVGDEGMYGIPGNPDYPYSDYEGVRSRDLLALTAVDYGTYHLYPQNWGSAAQADPVAWGRQWITDHIADGQAAGKPTVLEEYGLQVDAAKGVPDVAARDAGYRTWTDAVLSEGGAGDQFWILTARTDDGGLYGDYDGYRVVYPSSTATLLADHARAMADAS